MEIFIDVVGAVFCTIVVMIGIGINLLFINYIDDAIDRWLEIKNKHAINEEYELYLNFDIKAAKDEIVDLVDEYISNFVLYNFTIADKEYIGQEDAELMIKEVTRTIILNMSDYYLFLFRMIRNIDSDENLVLAVRDIVKERALMYITESNKPT